MIEYELNMIYAYTHIHRFAGTGITHPSFWACGRFHQWDWGDEHRPASCFGVISFMESEKCGDFHLKLAETCGLFITYILYPTNSNYLAISGHFLSLPWGLRWIGLTMHPAWRHEGFRIPAKTFKRRRQGGCGAPYGKLDLFHCYTIFGNNEFPGLITLWLFYIAMV